MRVRVPILVKLLGSLVLPVVVLFALFAMVAYEVSRRDLDDELGRRLVAIAASATTQVRGKYLAEVAPGNESDRAYQNVAKKLETVAQVTGARLFVLDAKYDSRVDTAGHTAIGTHDYRAELDRSELARVFAGTPVASVTFRGNDGIMYKTGYAPLRRSETEPEIDLVLGAQAPASYFDRLSDLRARLLAWGAGLAAVSVLAAILATFLITRNVRRLAAAAERIGAGDLQRAGRDHHARRARRARRHHGADARSSSPSAMRSMQQMLAGIAHEVRNPLAGMTLFAGILRDELPAADERRGHVDRIQRELDYLERVVNDFLEYARRPRPELADVAVAELFAEVIAARGARARGHERGRGRRRCRGDARRRGDDGPGRSRPAPPRAAQPDAQRGPGGVRRGASGPGARPAVRAAPRRRGRARGLEPRQGDPAGDQRQAVRAVLHHPREGHRPGPGVRARHRGRPRRARSR